METQTGAWVEISFQLLSLSVLGLLYRLFLIFGIMIWLDIRKLERELSYGNVTDKQGFNYLLLTFIIWSLTPYMRVEPYLEEMLTVVEVIIAIFVTAVALKMTFDINTEGGGRDYFKRFIAISFVVMLRLFLVILAIVIPLAIIGVSLDLAEEPETTDFIDFILGILVLLIYYFMVVRYFRRLKQLDLEQDGKKETESVLS